MDKVIKAITCVECLKTLESPVFLPCSHSICANHVREDNNKTWIKCCECDIKHKVPKNVGFPKNHALEEIISAKVTSLDFGVIHKHAKEKCKEVALTIEEIQGLLNDPSAFVREEIDELRNRVHLKNEQLKMDIEEKTEQLLNMLKEFENKSIDSLKTNELYSQRHIELDTLLRKTEVNLISCESSLNEFSIDEYKWQGIITGCNKVIKKIEERTKFLFLSFFGGSEYHRNIAAVEAFEKKKIFEDS